MVVSAIQWLLIGLLALAVGAWAVAVIVATVKREQKVRLWLMYIPRLLGVVLARYPLAPFAVWLFSTEDRRGLTRFKWLETIDNDLTGDNGWREEHLLGNDPLSYINRVRWLWRNGGNRVSYTSLSCPFDQVWVNVQVPGECYWVRHDGYWLYRRFIQWKTGRFIELFFGWNLFGEGTNGRCKIAFQIRGRTKTN